MFGDAALLEKGRGNGDELNSFLLFFTFLVHSSEIRRPKLTVTIVKHSLTILCKNSKKLNRRALEMINVLTLQSKVCNIQQSEETRKKFSRVWQNEIPPCEDFKYKIPYKLPFTLHASAKANPLPSNITRCHGNLFDIVLNCRRPGGGLFTV